MKIANKKNGNALKSQWQLKVKTSKPRKARENAAEGVVNGFSYALIVWLSGASFLDQSQSEVKQNRNNPRVAFNTIENCFISRKVCWRMNKLLFWEALRAKKLLVAS